MLVTELEVVWLITLDVVLVNSDAASDVGAIDEVAVLEGPDVEQ